MTSGPHCIFALTRNPIEECLLGFRAIPRRAVVKTLVDTVFHGTVKFVTLALNRVVIVRVTAGRRCHFVRCCKLIIRRTTLMVLVILSTCSSEKLLV